MGCLIPINTDNFIVAEKSISVTNITNGTTRLQPVVLQIGQAAGVMAALSIQEDISPAKLGVRKVQTQLLNAGGYLLPYLDVPNQSPSFQSLSAYRSNWNFERYRNECRLGKSNMVFP
jgi:hypothetical protein